MYIYIGDGFVRPTVLSVYSKSAFASKGVELLNAFAFWKPVLGTKLLEISVGRGLGALKGVREEPQNITVHFCSSTCRNT